jgi:hypothetical protein
MLAIASAWTFLLSYTVRSEMFLKLNWEGRQVSTVIPAGVKLAGQKCL